MQEEKTGIKCPRCGDSTVVCIREMNLCTKCDEKDLQLARNGKLDSAELAKKDRGTWGYASFD